MRPGHVLDHPLNPNKCAHLHLTAVFFGPHMIWIHPSPKFYGAKDLGVLVVQYAECNAISNAARRVIFLTRIPFAEPSPSLYCSRVHFRLVVTTLKGTSSVWKVCSGWMVTGFKRLSYLLTSSGFMASLQQLRVPR